MPSSNNWDVPGVQFVASEALIGYTADELLDLAASTECVSEGREDYDDGVFIGRFESYADCGGTGATSIVVAAFPSRRQPTACWSPCRSSPTPTWSPSTRS